MSPTDPVADDEIILRHIPGGTTWQAPGPRITSRNFRPRPIDLGVSVSRAGVTPPDSLLGRLGDPAKGSRIAAAVVADVRALGLEVVPVPRDYDLGHAEIRPGTADPHEQDVQRQLAQLFQFLPAVGS